MIRFAIVTLVLAYFNAIFAEDLLTSRDWIKTYHIRVEGSIERKDTATQFIRIEAWWNGKSYRSDVWISDSADFGNERVVTCTDCDRFGYTGKSTQADKFLTSFAYYFDNGQYGSSNIYYQDWRYIGFRHGRIVNGMGKDDKSAVLMFLNDPETKLTDEQSKSVYSIVTDKHTKRMTVDKSSGQPIAYFTSFKGGSTHETKIELAQVKDTSKFFPLTYSSVSHANDGSTTAKSEFKVTLADLNMPISPDVFTYKGMRLKNGTPVDLPGADRINNVPLLNEGVIDKRLTLSMASQFAASKQESIPPSPATPKPSLISQVWPYFLGFVVFAVIGFWLLRKQRQAAKEG